MGTFLGDSSFFGPCRDMEGWRKMNLIHRFILKKSVGVNQNPEGEASISRVMLGCSEIACFLANLCNRKAAEIFTDFIE